MNKFLIFATTFLFLLGVFIGPFGFDFFEIRDLDLFLAVVEIRVARILLAGLVGAGLAGAGAALQILIRNPLADPYIIGVSGGATVFGALSMLFFRNSNVITQPVASIVGSVFVMFFLTLALNSKNKIEKNDPLLLGIAINSFSAAIITIIKTMGSNETTQTMFFWLIGSIKYAQLREILPIFFIIATALLFLVRSSDLITVMSFGDDEAVRLGIEVKKEKLKFYIVIGFIIGLVISTTGMIGFVGLIVPNIVKSIKTNNTRALMVSSITMGACVLIFFDNLSRYFFHIVHTEIPVGTLTSALGAPVFCWLLVRKRNE